mmetsp:Transcript_27046/g.62260  ORF Transcript_27046/g.62260 Transcript_27046/m.62260 type:complete len:138 (-) Transcript_27046:2384-2797(-)
MICECYHSVLHHECYTLAPMPPGEVDTAGAAERRGEAAPPWPCPCRLLADDGDAARAPAPVAGAGFNLGGLTAASSMSAKCSSDSEYARSTPICDGEASLRNSRASSIDLPPPGQRTPLRPAAFEIEFGLLFPGSDE